MTERVEFGSPGWVDAARRFLTPRVAPFRGTRFAVCETYTDPPPHLSAGPISIHIVIDDGQATVDFGGREDVDFRVRADYTKAFAVAAAVYGHEPSRQGRLLRELTTRSGPVFAVRGSLEGAPTELQAVLVGLHDHLARRTIVSPDLAHRIEHLGLSGAVADLDRDGSTILENAFSARLAEELSVELGHGPPPDLVTGGPRFEEAAMHPWVLALAEHVLGPGFVLGTEVHGDVTCVWTLEDRSIAVWRGAARAAGRGATLTTAYASLSPAAVDRHRDVDPAVVQNNPPIMSTLLGLDAR